MNVYSSMFYFDTKNKKFVKKSSKTEDNPTRYIEVPMDILDLIAKKNLKSMLKCIKKHELESCFLHFTSKKLTRFDVPDNSPQAKKSLYYKPEGLWLSCGASWVEYMYENFNGANESNLFSYVYKIDVIDTVKVITSKDDLNKFIKKYKHKPDDIKMYDVIDWVKVRNEFQGIIITPYLGDLIWHLGTDVMNIQGAETAHEFFTDLMGTRWKNNMMLLSEWYRHWNCACGVIWNPEGIIGCSMIKEISFSSYI
jgi:hypothetical protein